MLSEWITILSGMDGILGPGADMFGTEMQINIIDLVNLPFFFISFLQHRKLLTKLLKQYVML